MRNFFKIQNLSYFFISKQLKNYIVYIYKNVPKCVLAIFNLEKSVFILIDSNFLIFFIKFIRIHYIYRYLIDLTAVDFSDKIKNCALVYFFRSLNKTNFFNLLFFPDLKLKIVNSVVSPVDSLSNMFKSTSWLEREILDMFGVFFKNHSDFRRLLNDYGFLGHPLKKNFPLTGYYETRYDMNLQRIILEPVELTQEFRIFDFLNPWLKQF